MFIDGNKERKNRWAIKGAEEDKNTKKKMKKINLFGSWMNGGVAIIKHLHTGQLQQGKWEAVREEV